VSRPDGIKRLFIVFWDLSRRLRGRAFPDDDNVVVWSKGTQRDHLFSRPREIAEFGDPTRVLSGVILETLFPWLTASVVSEDPDGHSRCRPPKRIVRRRQRAFKISGLTWIVERSFAAGGWYSCLLRDRRKHPLNEKSSLVLA
jgi:hypothetical protein